MRSLAANSSLVAALPRWEIRGKIFAAMKDFFLF